MKKSLIALSVLAGVVGIAHANETTLYGSMAHSVVVAKKFNGDKKNNWDLERSVARFGIRGNEDLSSGLQAFYRFEFNAYDNGLSGKEGTRYAYLGLRGDFGTLTLGRQDTLFKQATSFNDNFNDVYFDYHHGPNRVSKVISYVSPDMSGFKLGASMVLDGDNSVVTTSDSRGIDAWEAAAFYDANGIFAGGAYQSRDAGRKTDKYYGGSVGYKNDTFKVGFGYEKQDKADSYYNLAGEYYLGDNTFRAGFGYKDDRGKNNDWFEYALGYQYNLSKRTYTWVEGSYNDPRAKGKDENYKVVVGVRHDF